MRFKLLSVLDTPRFRVTCLLPFTSSRIVRLLLAFPLSCFSRSLIILPRFLLPSWTIACPLPFRRPPPQLSSSVHGPCFVAHTSSSIPCQRHPIVQTASPPTSWQFSGGCLPRPLQSVDCRVAERPPPFETFRSETSIACQGSFLLAIFHHLPIASWMICNLIVSLLLADCAPDTSGAGGTCAPATEMLAHHPEGSLHSTTSHAESACC